MTKSKDSKGIVSDGFRWVCVGYDSIHRDDFFNQLSLIENDGHLCFLPTLNTDSAYNRTRFATDLSDKALDSLLGPYCPGGWCLVATIVKDSGANAWIHETLSRDSVNT